MDDTSILSSVDSGPGAARDAWRSPGEGILKWCRSALREYKQRMGTKKKIRCALWLGFFQHIRTSLDKHDVRKIPTNGYSIFKKKQNVGVKRVECRWQQKSPGSPGLGRQVSIHHRNPDLCPLPLARLCRPGTEQCNRLPGVSKAYEFALEKKPEGEKSEKKGRLKQR